MDPRARVREQALKDRVEGEEITLLKQDLILNTLCHSMYKGSWKKWFCNHRGHCQTRAAKVCNGGELCINHTQAQMDPNPTLFVALMRYFMANCYVISAAFL